MKDNAGQSAPLTDGLFYSDLWYQQHEQMRLWALADLRKDFEAEVQIAAVSNSAVRCKDFSVDAHGDYEHDATQAMFVMWCAAKGIEL